MSEISFAMIQSDLIMARQAISYFEETNFKDVKNQAAYHIQQAAEKMIKIQIYANVTNVDNHRMYTHSLDRLIRYTETENIPIILPKYISEKRSMLTDWEAGSRYSLNFSVKINTLKKAYQEVIAWYETLNPEKGSKAKAEKNLLQK